MSTAADGDPLNDRGLDLLDKSMVLSEYSLVDVGTLIAFLSPLSRCPASLGYREGSRFDGRLDDSP